MYRADAARSGVHPGPAPIGPPSTLWTFKADDQIQFAPVVGNGTVFVGSFDGNVYALDALTGAKRWSFKGAGEITGSAAVVNDIIYTPDGGGALVALGAGTGSVRWRADVELAVTGSSSPVVADGIVYVPSKDGNAYGLDAATGTQRWSWHGTEPARGITIGPGTAFIGAEDRRLHAVSLANGQEKWYVQMLGSAVSSSMLDAGSVYVSNLPGLMADISELSAIDAATGVVRWRFQEPSGGQVLPGAVSEGVVYVSSAQSGVYALATEDGHQLWHADLPETHTAIALVGDELFLTSAEGNLIAINRSDGAELWRVPIASGADWGSAITSALIFQGGRDGTIHAFGDIPAGAPSPGATETPAPSLLPEAFELVKTFDAATSGLDDPAGLDVGPDGNLYVANARRDEILVLDPNGVIVRRWGQHGTGPGDFDFQRHDGNDSSGAVALDKQGFVYVADYVNNRVEKFTGAGKFVRQWGSYGQGDGQFLGPYDIGVGPDDSVYVIDEVRDDIQQFTTDGKYVATLGGHGSAPGQLDGGGGVWVDAAGTLFATDYNNSRIQAWDNKGSLLWTQGEYGFAPGNLALPNDIAVDGAGNLFVLETKVRVQVFDSQRRPIAAWTKPAADDEIDFITLGAKDIVYVSDYFGNHIYKLRLLPHIGG